MLFLSYLDVVDDIDVVSYQLYGQRQNGDTFFRLFGRGQWYTANRSHWLKIFSGIMCAKVVADDHEHSNIYYIDFFRNTQTKWDG